MQLDDLSIILRTLLHNSQSAHYQGATIFNKLPRELREETSVVVFKNKLRDYYRKT